MVRYCNIMVDSGHGRSKFLIQGCAMRNRPEVSKGEVQWRALIADSDETGANNRTRGHSNINL